MVQASALEITPTLSGSQALHQINQDILPGKPQFVIQPKTHRPTQIPSCIPSSPTNSPGDSSADSPASEPTCCQSEIILTHFPRRKPRNQPALVPWNSPAFSPTRTPTNYPWQFHLQRTFRISKHSAFQSSSFVPRNASLRLIVKFLAASAWNHQWCQWRSEITANFSNSSRLDLKSSTIQAMVQVANLSTCLVFSIRWTYGHSKVFSKLFSKLSSQSSQFVIDCEILCRVLLIDNHGMHPHKFQVLLQALTQDILPLQRLIVQFPAASSLLITYCAFPTAFILIREILAMLQDFLQAIDPSMPTVNCGVSCRFHLKSLAMSAKIWNHCWFHWWFKAGSKISGHSSNS